mmetsp:Transcript_69302/g.225813  ORF Transcript_69302/g.225813 Transcript_69302/m.225813 type:complete len:233 (+) Transcript_69302:721-1419(+)
MMLPQLKPRVDINQSLDQRPHVVYAQTIFGNHVSQSALVRTTGLLIERQGPLKITQIFFCRCHCRNFVRHEDVDNSVRLLHFCRPNLFGLHDTQAPTFDHGGPSHADVAALGCDDDVTAAQDGSVTCEAAARGQPDEGHEAGEPAERRPEFRDQTRSVHAAEVRVAGPPSTALAEPDHGDLLVHRELHDAVALVVVGKALCASKHGVVVADHRSACTRRSESGRIDGADARN